VIGAVMQRVRAVPRAGRVCFVIAFANAAIWSVLIPPFHVPDEIAHFAYAQYLAETGKPPPQGPYQPYSPQEYAALDGLHTYLVAGRPQVRAIITKAEDRALRAELATGPSPKGRGGSSASSNQPPLYYSIAAIPYLLSPSHDILTRLELMRLVSALLAAGTVLCVFFFLRELLPGTPWAWTVGALAVAFQPTFGFIAGGVQADNLLFFASAATFLALLRAYRHGLTVRRGVAIGAATAAGALSKLPFVALMPGILLALAILTWRALPTGRREAVRSLAITLAVIAVPLAIYALLNATVWHRGSPTAGGFASVTAPGSPTAPVTLHQTFDYIWELYLPRLPFMNHDYFPMYPLWSTWLNGSIGRFGWVDYGFPNWVYDDGRWLFYALAALATVGVIRLRWSRIKTVVPIFAAFFVMAVGLLGAIGWEGIRWSRASGYPFEQARYLFPLLVFYAAFVVLAARGTPRRWAPAVGAALVVLAMAHDLFAATLTISRYYG
jgi:4-amino-4-deoxy-L-arabinose transferase-like glycosyltransferase